jgi:rubredoxin
MKKYKCRICGYVYYPEKGDPISDIKPNTAFENLPDSWICPICEASKDKFIKEG